MKPAFEWKSRLRVKQISLPTSNAIQINLLHKRQIFLFSDTVTREQAYQTHLRYIIIYTEHTTKMFPCLQ